MGHHYFYGVTEYDQPNMPRYDCGIRHKSPGLRDFPFNVIRDDGSPYKEYTSESYCESCNKCNRVARFNTMNNLVNIETYIDKILTITLYGTSKDLDKTVKMRLGNKYCITYITEKGLQTVTGIFKEISSNIPDECTRYIGIYNSISTAAYIGMDCSTAGESDKRLIYIASIRYVEELFDDQDDQYTDLSQEEKLNYLYTNITTTLANLTEFIETNNQDNSDDEPENADDGESNADQNHMPPPPPPYRVGPWIIGARPPFPPPPPPGIWTGPYIYGKPTDLNNKESSESNNFDSDNIIESLNTIKLLLDSFINAYLNSKAEETCNCDCCNKNNETTDSNNTGCNCSNQSTEDDTSNP